MKKEKRMRKTFHSLKKNRDFQEVYHHRKSVACKTLIMYIFENPENLKNNINRIGISVSKRVGNSVIRHRIKRVIREIIRTNDAIFRKGLDIVIVARVEAKELDFEGMKRDILYLSSKLGLLQKKKEKSYETDSDFAD